MGSLWPETFSEEESRTPKEIIEEQLKYLPRLTKDMVYGELTEANSGMWDFGYSFRIRGKFLDNYNFLVLYFYHDLLLYPMKISLDRTIADELGCEAEIQLNNQDELEGILEKILRSEHVRKVIGIIMKMSK